MNKERLAISIPVKIDNSHDKKEIENICAQAIKDNESDFAPLFERLADKGDARVSVLDESIDIDHIEVDDNLSGCVGISFRTEFFTPCKDMRSIDDEETFQDFDIINGFMEFDIEMPPAWRPDEHDM